MIKKSVIITSFLLVVFSIAYPLVIYLFGLLFPNFSEGLPVYMNGKRIGFENIGQFFNNNKYFMGRPSASDYNPMLSGGSNMSVSNEIYQRVLKERIDTILKYNPGIAKQNIPSELITASASGLDPHISLKGALIQIPRIARSRNIPEHELELMVKNSIEKSWYDIFGIEKVNVLKLNLILDKFYNKE